MTYTARDAGCYARQERGAFIVDRIVSIAQHEGMPAPEPCAAPDCLRCVKSVHAANNGTYTEWGHCRYASDVEREATEYMETHHAVVGYRWGQNEGGDWGLWPNARDCPPCDVVDDGECDTCTRRERVP